MVNIGARMNRRGILGVISKNEDLNPDPLTPIFYFRVDVEDRIKHYIELPGILGCQTKMVLGYLCGTDIDVSPAMIAEAKRRIREEFLFVGISKPYFNESINLFHEQSKDKFGAQPLKEPELSHARNQKTDRSLFDKAFTYLKNSNFDDEIGDGTSCILSLLLLRNKGEV